MGDLRDRLYVTEYIMNMFSYATFENENYFDLVKEKGQSVTYPEINCNISDTAGAHHPCRPCSAASDCATVPASGVGEDSERDYRTGSGYVERAVGEHLFPVPGGY
mgnify:CR=1 FL=1